MEIITRQQAKANGLTKYFTGKPCLRGHIATRNVRNAGCQLCNHKRKVKGEEVLRRAIFTKHGNKCKSCGFDNPKALQIDHVNGGGHKERITVGRYAILKKALEDTTGTYQLLCANCNWIKRIDNKEHGGKLGETMTVNNKVVTTNHDGRLALGTSGHILTGVDVVSP